MPTKRTIADDNSHLSDDALRRRAYELWEADGRPEGRSDHYWHLASAEARQRFVEKTADAVARIAKGRNPHDPPPALKAKLKAKPKSDEAKPAKKADTKPRAAVQKGP